MPQISTPASIPLAPAALHERRERVFLVLAGLFLGTLAMLNILGITRFIDLSFVLFGVTVPFALAVGVLPYPLTFLCTDFISELYGQKRANFVVWVGLGLNLWVMFILWLGGALPPYPPIDTVTGLPPLPTIDPETGGLLDPHQWTYFRLQTLAFGAVTASMVAYLAAQFCDVYLFHFWKRLTKGKHLWLRNNGSTMVSQLVDSTAVILITYFYAHALPPLPEGRSVTTHLLIFIGSSYVFKFAASLLDTGPFYLGVYYLRRYLRLEEGELGGDFHMPGHRSGGPGLETVSQGGTSPRMSEPIPGASGSVGSPLEN